MYICMLCVHTYNQTDVHICICYTHLYLYVCVCVYIDDIYIYVYIQISQIPIHITMNCVYIRCASTRAFVNAKVMGADWETTFTMRDPALGELHWPGVRLCTIIPSHFLYLEVLSSAGPASGGPSMLGSSVDRQG